MATAEFSKFAGILTAALSQHHLSGFEMNTLSYIVLKSTMICYHLLPRMHSIHSFNADSDPCLNFDYHAMPFQLLMDHKDLKKVHY